MVKGRGDVEDVCRALLRMELPRILLAHGEEACLDVRIIPAAFATSETNRENRYAQSGRDTYR